jgi:hypothetical protein
LGGVGVVLADKTFALFTFCIFDRLYSVFKSLERTSMLELGSSNIQLLELPKKGGKGDYRGYGG